MGSSRLDRPHPEPAAATALPKKASDATKRATREKGEKSKDVPDLSGKAVNDVEKLIKKGKRQQALNKVVDDASQSGTINKSLLVSGKMFYDSSIGGEGAVNPPGYGADGKAKKSKVKIGAAAFTKGLPWLYSSMMHEYWHVQQFQKKGDSPSLVPGQGSAESLINQQEVEAYCWELLHAQKNTGMYKHPAQMEDAWTRLHDNYWIHLSKKNKKPLLNKVKKAHAIAEKATGKKLDFVQ